MSGECLVERGAEHHPGETSEERAEGSHTGGGEEAAGVHERDEEVRYGQHPGDRSRCAEELE